MTTPAGPLSNRPKTTIRPLRLTETRAFYALFVQAVRQNFAYFPAEHQTDVIRAHRPLALTLAIIHPRRLVLTARHGGEIVGYAISAVPKGGHGQLFWLYVKPGRRGSNTGLALLSRTIKLHRLLGATEVVLATHDHRHYYERQGFVWRDNRLVDNVSMDIMSFPLEQPS